MTVKQLIPGLCLAAASLITISGCKKTTMVAPQADTELQSSVDASFALFRFTDAEMVAAFITESVNYPKFYDAVPGSPGSLSPIQNIDDNEISLSFGDAGSGANCADGVYRQGTVYVEREPSSIYNALADQNSLYYRRAGFAGRMHLINYTVDGWNITTTNGAYTTEGDEIVILNQMKNNADRSTKASWSIKGSFKISKDNQIIYCTVDLVKKLVNTSDPAVFPTSLLSSINWPLATVAYSGKVSGKTFDGRAFTMTIAEDQAIIRDFTCSPDAVTDVTANSSTLSARTTEFHPFKDGTAQVTVASLYPREIYFGGSQTVGKGQCDNSGSIMIKGISYPVDFKK